MAGHATSLAPIAPTVDEGSCISVAVPGQGPGPLRLFDGRPRIHWSEAEVQQAVDTQQKKAGALVALVRDRIEATWSEIRRELNEAAGGQASARVMVMAHHAMRAHQALELQTLLAEKATGMHNEGQKADPNNSLRNQSGLSVIATQALNQAFDAARAEAGSKQASPTEQLMARLGVGRVVPAQDSGAAASPAEGRGGISDGSRTPSIPAPLDPLSGEQQ